MSKIDKELTMKEAQRIKKALLDCKKPDLGLTDGDVKLTQDADGYVEFEILKGRLPEHQDGAGASAKNISAAIEDDFREFRKKNWDFTQPVGGVFTIGVPSNSMNESTSFTFAKFLEQSM